MKVRSVLKIAMTFALVLLSGACKKNIHTGEGTNNVVYERKYADHYEIETAPMLQKQTFVIGDVDVYRDAMGMVTQIVFGSEINDKPNWIRNVTISDLKLSEHMKINLTNDNSNLHNNLVNCQLFYCYYPIDNSGEKKVLLANFIEYNASGEEVIMQPTGQDLTSLFTQQFTQQHTGGQLRLVFHFSQTPHDVGNMRLWYTIPFSYAYTFSSMEAKK